MSDLPEEASILKEIPLFYRLVLRFPKLSLDAFPEKLKGVFWAVFVPIFVVGYVYMNLMIVVLLSFPINLVIVSVLLFIVFLSVFRIHLDRLLNSQTAMLKKTPSIDIKERVNDYASRFEKKDGRGRTRRDSE